MKDFRLSRRQVMGMVGVAAVVAPSIVTTQSSAAEPDVLPRSDTPSDDADSIVALVHPLAPGSMLGVWRVEEVGTLRAGAATIELSDDADHRFYLDICARDRAIGAPTPPARTDKFDIFVVNEGDGSMPTLEGQGLAAMAVAEIVRTNEHRLNLQGFLTLSDRLAKFPGKVVRGFRDAT